MNNKEKVFLYFFTGAFLVLIFLALHILSPFFTGIFGAVILCLIFWPVHRLSLHLIGREKPNLAAGTTTAALLIVIVLPLCLIGWLVYEELQQAYPIIERFANTLEGWRRGKTLTHTSPVLEVLEAKLKAAVKLSGLDLRGLVLEALQSTTDKLIAIGKAMPRNALSLFANFFVMVTTLFFLFRDGLTLLRKMRDLIPMDEKYKDHIVHQLYITLTAVVRGVLIVAVVQGTLAAAGFAIARVPSPILLGFMTTLLAIVPLVGAGIIWGCVAIYYFLSGALLKGLFVFLWGFFVVSLVDNFLRPILIGGETRLPFFALFLGLVGGIKVYGPMGLFFGPLIVALILAFIRIYREEYAVRLKKEERPPAPK